MVTRSRLDAGAAGGDPSARSASISRNRGATAHLVNGGRWGHGHRGFSFRAGACCFTGGTPPLFLLRPAAASILTRAPSTRMAA